TTAIYLSELLAAFSHEPLPSESFALMLQAGLDDPTESLTGLHVVGRRLLPPTRLLRSASMTVDPFLLRGASLGAGWRAERDGAAGAVYHAVGGVPPLASGLPVVVTLLDLAPWDRPGLYLRSPAARFGHRLRTRRRPAGRRGAAALCAIPRTASPCGGRGRRPGRGAAGRVGCLRAPGDRGGRGWNPGDRERRRGLARCGWCRGDPRRAARPGS